MTLGRNFDMIGSRGIFLKLLSLVKNNRHAAEPLPRDSDQSSCARWCHSLFLGMLMQPVIAESTDLFLTDSPFRGGPSCSLTQKMEAFKTSGNVNSPHPPRPLTSMHPAEET